MGWRVMSVSIGLVWCLLFLVLLGFAIALPLRRRGRLRKSLQSGFVRSWELSWFDRRLIKNGNVVLSACATVMLLIVWWSLLALLVRP